MDDETLKYGTIAKAASLGKYQINENSSSEGIWFTWLDLMTGGALQCPVKKERKEAFIAACDLIQETWILNPNETQS